MLKKLFINRKLIRLQKVANYHLNAFNYHSRVVEKTSDETTREIHQQHLIKQLTELEGVNKKISLLETS